MKELVITNVSIVGPSHFPSVKSNIFSEPMTPHLWWWMTKKIIKSYNPPPPKKTATVWHFCTLRKWWIDSQNKWQLNLFWSTINRLRKPNYINLVKTALKSRKQRLNKIGFIILILCRDSIVRWRLLSHSVGVIGLKLHLERSQPEPVAWADPLTHFLSPAPAHCQGEPLVEKKRETKRDEEKSKGEKEKKSESKKG